MIRNAKIIIVLACAFVLPQEGPGKWAFKLSVTEAVAVNRGLGHMVRNQVKTVGVISLANSFGEGFVKALETAAPQKGVRITTVEKYHATDQSVTAQALKVLATNPDAVYIFSSGTAGALPHIVLVNRGYKGKIYQTQGVANNDFLRVGGAAVEGGFITIAPVMVVEQLPDAHPSKKASLDFLRKWDARHGAATRNLFSATAWDALLLLEAGTKEALKKAKPGTPEFRTALRDALEGVRNLAGTTAVYDMSPQDHNGVDERSQELARIEKGTWKHIP